MKMTLKKLIATTFIVGMTALPVQAQDEDMQNIVDRLERMDRDIKALNLKVYRGTETTASTVATGGEDVSGPLGARLSVRINELESQLRNMTGQIEETAYRISQLNTRLDKLVADVDYRLTALEGGTPAGLPNTNTVSQLPTETNTPSGITGQQLTPPPGGQVAQQPVATGTPPGTLGTLTQKDLDNAKVGAPATPSPTAIAAPTNTTSTAAAPAVETASLTPEALYQQAHKMLARGDYANAETSFNAFLENHKDHKLAGNVRHWIGELHYAQGNYPQAANTFLKSYQKSPRGAKAPDSLLKLGMSLKRMDKIKEACATYGKLRADFPKLPAHLSKTLERERTKAQCK
ncbi:tol-pal system protein YbgF [Terasakiella sp. A23]|uniref:tol-pal system protein YbgF n=1 Tax=Terasakiella sp. FCG-A23 TaxID=3080561 RepID=UPI0029530226|nr:tol-pal system protein YbgF [Terasakiella sp. A23]MDV7339116.1 tol-pal system protein YbgF [Terasakiella sp. A23]